MNKLLSVALFTCIACASDTQTNTYSVKPTSKVSVKHLLSTPTQQSAGEKILKTGEVMALQTKEIVRGSCWDYIHTVYNRAGYPQSKRQYILKGKKRSGPYAKPDQIQPGDWLYYINHSYNGVEHSGIFVRWIDKKKRIASILSYGGESRKKPGRYRNYDLSNVYTIIRAKN